MAAVDKFCLCCLLVETEVDSHTPLQCMTDEKFEDEDDSPRDRTYALRLRYGNGNRVSRNSTSLINAYFLVNYNLEENTEEPGDHFICNLCRVQLKSAFDFGKLRGNPPNDCYCCSVAANKSNSPFLDLRKESFTVSGEKISYEKCFLDVKKLKKSDIPASDTLLTCKACVVQMENAFLFRKLCIEAWNAVQKQDEIGETIKTAFKCSDKHCKKSYKTIEFLEVHEKTHSVRIKHPKRFKCDECPMKFSELREFRAHVQTIHEKKMYKCQFKSCLRKYTHPDNLRRHVRDDHENKHECKQCPKTFSTNDFLQCHIRSVHENNPYVCSICKKKYEHPRSLSIHEKTVHLGMRFQCKKCPKSYSKQIQLDHHTLASHKNNPYTCDLCGETYQSKIGVRAHLQSVHVKKRHQCGECPKSYVNPLHLRYHIRAEHRNQKFECMICKAEFNNHSEFSMHRRKVHDGFPKKCELCLSEYYNTKASLKKHKEEIH